MPRRSEPIVKVSVRGKTRYRAVTDVSMPTERRRQARRTFDTLREARSWLAATRTAVDTGTYIAGTNLTVTEAVADWLDSKKTEVRPATLYNYGVHLGNLKSALGEMRVRDVRRRDIERARDAMVERGLKKSTVTTLLTLSRQMFGWLVANEVLANNPADHVKPTGAKSEPSTAFTTGAMLAIRRAIVGNDFELAFVLTLYGLRRSEVLGLRWSDYDSGGGTLAIQRSRTQAGSKGSAVGAPKTERGRRQLPIDRETADLFAALRRVQAGVYGISQAKDGFIVVNEIGMPLRPEAYSDAWRSALHEAGLPYMDLRAARRSAVTALRLRGVPDPIVARWAGHDEAVMRRYYTGIETAELADASDAIAAVLRGA